MLFFHPISADVCNTWPPEKMQELAGFMAPHIAPMLQAKTKR